MIKLLAFHYPGSSHDFTNFLPNDTICVEPNLTHLCEDAVCVERGGLWIFLSIQFLHRDLLLRTQYFFPLCVKLLAEGCWLWEVGTLDTSGSTTKLWDIDIVSGNKKVKLHQVPYPICFGYPTHHQYHRGQIKGPPLYTEDASVYDAHSCMFILNINLLWVYWRYHLL